MNIGIIDADLIGAKKHRFPNLASMKISSYNKNLGNNVKLITTWDEDFSQYDDIYLSKVFTATEVPQNVIELPNIHCGGTGFFYDKAPPLKDEIEHCVPDYHLYDDWISTLVERERERERKECFALAIQVLYRLQHRFYNERMFPQMPILRESKIRSRL